MSEMANSRRAGLSAKPPVAEHGLHRPSYAASFRGGATPRRGQTGAVVAVLALTLGVLLCGGAAPAAPAGQAQVAIVVLGPRFVSGGSGEAMAAAELACDRLARELEKNASLRVVDRTQLDRILNERRLVGPGEKAIRVRLLEVDNPGKSARLELLADRLRETFASALARSEGVRPVHHFEAAMAKEALEVGRDIQRRYPRNSFREALARYNRQLAKQIEGKSK
jgi:hypothetical protein